jgi:hypothetical protein
MSTESVQAAAIEVANLVSQRKYRQALEMCTGSRLTAEDLDSVMNDYGRSFLSSSLSETHLDVIAIDDRNDPTWSIWVPLRTNEEGRSDLQLELTVTISPSGLLIELDDLRVP